MFVEGDSSFLSIQSMASNAIENNKAQKIEELEGMLEDLTLKVDSLEEEIEENEKEIQELREEKTEVVSNHASVFQELSTMKEERSTMIEELKQMGEELGNMEEITKKELLEAHNLMNMVDEECEIIKLEKQQVEEENETLLREIEELKEKLSSSTNLQSTIDELKTSQEQFDSEKDQLQSTIDELKTSKEEWESKYNDMCDEHEKMVQLLDEKKEELGSISKQLEDLQESSAISQFSMGQSQQDGNRSLSSLQTKYDLVISERDTLQVQLDEKIKDMREVESLNYNKEQELNSQLSSFEVKCETMKKEHAYSMRDGSDQSMKRLKECEEMWTQKVEDMKIHHYNEMEDLKQDHKNQLEESSQPNQQACEACSEIQSNLDEMNVRYTRKCQEVTKMMEELEGERVENDRLTEEIQGTSTDETLIAEMNAMLEHKMEVESKNDKLSKQIVELQSELESHETRSIQEQRLLMEAGDERLSDLREELTEKICTLSATITQLKNTAEERDEEKEEYQRTLEEREEMISEVQAELYQTRLQLETEQSRTTANSNNKNDLSNTQDSILMSLSHVPNDEEEEEGEDFIKQNEEIANLRQTLEEKNRRIKKLESVKLTTDQLEKIKKMKVERNELRGQVQDLKSIQERGEVMEEKLKKYVKHCQSLERERMEVLEHLQREKIDENNNEEEEEEGGIVEMVLRREDELKRKIESSLTEDLTNQITDTLSTQIRSEVRFEVEDEVRGQVEELEKENLDLLVELREVREKCKNLESINNNTTQTTAKRNRFKVDGQIFDEVDAENNPPPNSIQKPPLKKKRLPLQTLDDLESSNDPLQQELSLGNDAPGECKQS